MYFRAFWSLKLALRAFSGAPLGGPRGGADRRDEVGVRALDLPLRAAGDARGPDGGMQSTSWTSTKMRPGFYIEWMQS